MTTFVDSMTLGEAREELRRLVEHGHDCPCCSQLAKVYRRSINSTMARALILIYRTYGLEFGSVPELRTLLAPHHSNEEPKLRYWGLLEEELAKREDGGRAGWWRVTDAGEEWLLGRSTVPKYARIYDGRCLGLVGKPVSVADALGSQFDYRELMAA